MRRAIGEVELGFGFDYTHDARGQRLSMTEPAGLHTYTYDTLGRLTAATHPQVTNPDEFFTYDPIGNRLSSHLSASYTYSTTNRLLADAEFDYIYDANGNMTRKTRRATGEQTNFTYNAGNQLVGITLPGGVSVAYFYDGLGRRIEKSVNGAVTRYLYDGERLLCGGGVRLPQASGENDRHPVRSDPDDAARRRFGDEVLALLPGGGVVPAGR